VAKKRNKRPTPQAFLDLETQFDQLCGKSDFDEEAAAEIASQISEICSRLPLTPMFQFGESLTYSDWFIKKLYRRYRSSGDWLDYAAERSRILAHLAEAYAENNRQNLDKNTRQRHRKTSERNVQMAREYLRRRKQNSHQSDSVLKELIGSKEGLKRSASITAIDDGLAQLGHHPK
jgi:hypothetical protein